MLRFVILFHQTPPGYIRQNHYDLLLEAGEVLRAWAVVNLPGECPQQSAEKLPDHRPLYLEYEGPIAGDRGGVSRVDEGTYVVLNDDTNGLSVELTGGRHRGTLQLMRNGERWTAAFVPK